MATPGELIEAVHRATGVALPTIVDLDRKLVKAGLRTKAGRGLNAARMTPLDAARLLTAVLTSSHANAAAEAVDRYAQACLEDRLPATRSRSTAWSDALNSLPADHNFVDALAALLTEVPSRASGKVRMPEMHISALTQATRGSIRIAGSSSGFRISMDYVPQQLAKGDFSGQATRHFAGPTGDLEQSRRITERTVFAVAECLHI